MKEKCIIYFIDIDVQQREKFIAKLETYKDLNKIAISLRNSTSIDFLKDYFNKIYEIDDFFDKNELHSLIKKIKKNFSIEALYSPKENLIEVAGECRTRFGIKGLQENQTLAVRNKWIMKEMLNQNGIETLAHAIIDDTHDLLHFIEKNGFPFIAKPLSGFASLKTKKICNINEALSFHEIIKNEVSHYLVEDFINGEEYHCDSVVHNRTVKFASVSKYLYNCLDIATEKKPPASIVYPNKASNQATKKIQELNKSVIEILGINNSITHGEYFVTSTGKVYLGEIGARIGGADVMPQCILNSFGIDFFDAMVDIELGIFDDTMVDANEMFTGMICLPSKSGIVKKIPTYDDFYDIDGIVEFKVFNKIGDRIIDVEDTMTRTGYAIIESESFPMLEKKLLKVYARFDENLVVDPHEEKCVIEAK